MLALSSSRKADLTATAEAYHLALAESLVSQYLADRGINAEQAAQYQLGVVSNPKPVHEPYAGRLAIPFVTPTGVVAMRFRCIEDHDCKEAGHAKYLQEAGQRDFLYNVGALHERHPAIAISEGELDCMVVDTHVMPCIGITGATKWKPHWGKLVEDFSRVFVIGDGDSAGRKFVDKLMETLPNVQPVVMPKDHDVNSYFLEHGADALSAFVLGEGV